MKDPKSIQDLGPIQLWRLRKDVVLNSHYLNDYTNRYGIDPKLVCNFFDCWLDYLSQLMKEEIPDYQDNQFFDYIDLFDTSKNLHSFFTEWNS